MEVGEIRRQMEHIRAENRIEILDLQRRVSSGNVIKAFQLILLIVIGLKYLLNL